MLPICPITILALKPKPKGYPTSLNTLAHCLLAKRLDLKLTKVDLAKILKVSAMSIYDWERGVKIPLPRIMKNIILFLGYIPPLCADRNTFGGKLFIYRQVNGLTQNELALSLQIDHGAICKMENNQDVSEHYISKIRELLSL